MIFNEKQGVFNLFWRFLQILKNKKTPTLSGSSTIF